MSRAHGTRNRYVIDRCRCRPCRDAASTYERERLALARARAPFVLSYAPGPALYVVRDTRSGEIVFRSSDRGQARQKKGFLNAMVGRSVDAPPPLMASDDTMREVRAHLIALREAGFSDKRISKLSGVTYTRISETINQRTYSKDRPEIRRMRQVTADKLLAVPITPLESAADGARTDAAETWRLIDEMLAAGATKARIASELAGKPVPALQLSRSKVRVSTARAIKTLHDRFYIGSERMRQTCTCRDWRNDELERKRREKAESRARIRERTG